MAADPEIPEILPVPPGIPEIFPAPKGRGVSDWIPTLLRKTAAHEGNYWSVQKNLDGQGVSFGILQWTQRGGGLGKLLAAMYRADPAAFRDAFGGTASAQAILAGTAALSETGRMAPVAGAVLWAAPWLARFDRAGRVPVFQGVQQSLAASTEYMQGAVAVARLLDVRTERAMVLFFNRTVHQGASGALAPARAMAAWYAEDPTRRPKEPKDVLAQYAWRCAAAFRRTTAPEKENYNASGTIKWKRVASEWSDLGIGSYAIKKIVPTGTVWHAVTGSWSLFDLITKRSSEILLATDVRDVDVDLSIVSGVSA